MPEISHIDIVSIPVRDQNIAKAFYREKLGFETVRDNPMGPDRRWVQLAPPSALTSITLVTWFEKMPPGCVQGLVLATDDVVAARSALVARGLPSPSCRKHRGDRTPPSPIPTGTAGSCSNGTWASEAAPRAELRSPLGLGAISSRIAALNRRKA